MKSKTGYNSTSAIGGALCSAESVVFPENSVLRMNICAEKPAIANLRNVIGNPNRPH